MAAGICAFAASDRLIRRLALSLIRGGFAGRFFCKSTRVCIIVSLRYEPRFNISWYWYIIYRMNICVFCSANDLDERYNTAARQLGELIASGGHTLIWGGSNVGMMKILADAASSSGGKIVGISMEILRYCAREDADELIVAKDLAERKQIMLQRSDVFVILPGGTGTIDEMFEIIEMKKHRTHDKRTIVLNADNFYDGLKRQLEHMETEGFLTRPLDQIVRFTDTPEEVMRTIG